MTPPTKAKKRTPSRKSKRKPTYERQREPTSGGFKPGDPRINYKGRPPDLGGYRRILREEGEEKALNYLLECMELGEEVNEFTGLKQKRKPNHLGLMAAVEWLHQSRGKPRQQLQLTGMDDGPVRVADGPDLSKLSVVQLKQWRDLVRAAHPDPDPATH